MPEGPPKPRATSTEPISIPCSEAAAEHADVAIQGTEGISLLESMRRVLPSPCAREEGLHEALQTMIRGRQLESAHSSKTLLKAAPRNGPLDRLRRYKARRAFEARLAEAMQGADVDSSDPQYECERILRPLLQSLADLPIQQRQAIELMRLEGLSAAETAARMCVPERTVRRAVTRALFRLHSEIDAAGSGE